MKDEVGLFPKPVGHFCLLPSAFFLMAALVTPVLAQPAGKASVADVALYQGADRAQRLIEGAKKEGSLSVYTSATVEDMAVITSAFEKKHGVKVEIVTGITTEWVAKLMAAGPYNPPFDVIVGNEPPLPLPRERGFFDKRNEAFASNIKTVYPKAVIGDSGVVLFWSRIGLAYRTDLVKLA